MVKIKNVLFVCTGNSCRSVFAEYYARWLKENKYKQELKDITFDSAGIRHFFETPRDGTINYLKSKGISVDDFVVKDLTDDLINNNDLILGFERIYHVKKAKRRFKHIDGLDTKIFLLRKYIGEVDNLDIKDPINLPPDEYNKILQIIEDAVEKLLKKIIKPKGKEA